MIEGEEVKDTATLARVKTVDEMIPVPAENQIAKWNQARIGEEQYRIIESYLMMDATIEEACMAAWISVASYYHHKRENPEFDRRMAMAKEYPKVIARAAVMRRIRQWDSKTAMDYLKLRDRRYTQNAVEGTGQNNAPIVQFISVPSNEWADQTENDSQTSTKPEFAYHSSSSSWEVEKRTPWENEEQVLRNIDSLSFSSD